MTTTEKRSEAWKAEAARVKAEAIETKKDALREATNEYATIHRLLDATATALNWDLAALLEGGVPAPSFATRETGEVLVKALRTIARKFEIIQAADADIAAADNVLGEE